jgi:hypothetical protein
VASDWGFSLFITGLTVIPVWLRYRAARKQVQQSPWSDEKLANYRDFVASARGLMLSRSRDELYCQERPGYARRREVGWGLVALVMASTGAVLLLIGYW